MQRCLLPCPISYVGANQEADAILLNHLEIHNQSIFLRPSDIAYASKSCTFHWIASAGVETRMVSENKNLGCLRFAH
jgi:hypothetical protein